MKTFSSLLLSYSLTLCLGMLSAQVCQESPSRCSTTTCHEPDCACSLSVPDVPIRSRPQIIYLTFQGYMSRSVEEAYLMHLFDGEFLNPNRCPIRATHFISHFYNDYTVVNEYYRRGHEMASMSITNNPDKYYWLSLTEQDWSDEMADMRRMMSAYANMPLDAIKGMRAPTLQGGGDAQFSMMAREGFTYDHSMPSLEHGYLSTGVDGAWPYTLDYKSEMDCQIYPCPTCGYEGLWAQPLLSLEDNHYGATGDLNYGGPCDILDNCVITSGSDATDVFDMMLKNFDRSYYGNVRAPITFASTLSYFYQDWHFQGYRQFIDHIVHNFDDVWFVPVAAGIEYRKSPMTNDELKEGLFDPFNCNAFPSDECVATTCKYEDVETDTFYRDEVDMIVCTTDCPPYYPWLHDPYGQEPKEAGRRTH